MAKGVLRNRTVLRIIDYWRDLLAIGNLSAVAHCDLETYMPERGAAVRGEAMARAAGIRQKLFLNKDFISLIHKAQKEKNLNDYEKGVIRLLSRDLKFYEKLPPEFLKDFERLTNESTVIWRTAKEKDNFKLFAPYLTKIFDAEKKMADYLGYKNSPYDALLDQYEEGLAASEVETFFNQIREPLKNLLSQILQSDKHNKSHFLERAGYDREKLKNLNLEILKLFWSDQSRFRLDISTHPFTTSFSNTDTRITTRYHKTDFAGSLMSVIHEFGHALYDLQCADTLQMTPVAGGSSLVIHESQSRFWENFIGRSDGFIRAHVVDFKGLSPEIRRYVGKYGLGGLRDYFNKVSPGFIRVDADEVTYHFHIMLRFEIEKVLIEGKLKAKDLPDIWRAKMKEYLGITPKKDSDGVLQDIHWSHGSVGYFPTYSLGTFLSAQWAEKMNLEFRISDLEFIKTWLRLHIHQFGSTYTLAELLKKNKMKFDPSVNLNYLQKKYAK